MSANIVISLDTGREKTAGTYPLFERIVHNKLATYINIGINFFKKIGSDNNIH